MAPRFQPENVAAPSHKEAYSKAEKSVNLVISDEGLDGEDWEQRAYSHSQGVKASAISPAPCRFMFRQLVSYNLGEIPISGAQYSAKIRDRP